MSDVKYYSVFPVFKDDKIKLFELWQLIIADYDNRFIKKQLITTGTLEWCMKIYKENMETQFGHNAIVPQNKG